MRFSQIGIIILLSAMALSLTGCGAINGIFARRDLIEGAKAYKDRNYAEAEKRFRNAMELDPSQKSARVFLARTLHSYYAADRNQTAKAEEAIAVYKEVLKDDPADNSSFKAVASILETMQRKDEAKQWLIDRTTTAGVPDDQKAEAFVSLAAKQNTCANDISDVEPVKKTVTKGDKSEFVFSKPENQADYDKFKACVEEGTGYIDKAIALESQQVKNAKAADIANMDDKQLTATNDLVKKFESAWSYKTSLQVQAMRLADMDGRTADRDSLKASSEEGRKRFLELAGLRKAIEDEKERRRQQAEIDATGKATTNTDANSNANATNK